MSAVNNLSKFLIVFCTFMLFVTACGDKLSTHVPTHFNSFRLYDGLKTKISTTTTSTTISAINTISRPTTVLMTTSIRLLYCDTEPFEHFYLLEADKKILHLNNWRKTPVGHSGTLQDVCLLSNGLPLTRRCLLSDPEDSEEQKPVWENISHWSSIECMNQTRQHIISNELNALHSQLLMGEHLKGGLEMRRNMMQQVQDLVHSPSAKMLPADVHFVTEIMKQLVNGLTDVTISRNMLNICDTLMSSDKRVLQLASKLNATNALLDTFETYMDAMSQQVVASSQCDVDLDITVTTVDKSAKTTSERYANTVQYMDMSYVGVYAELSPNISVFHVNPECDQISGIAIYDVNAVSNVRELHLWQYQGSFKFGFIYFRDTIENLRNEPNLQVATFLTKNLWTNIQKKLMERNQKATLVIKLYGNDAFFVENRTLLTAKPNGKVLSISIPHFNEKLSEPLPFLIRNKAAESSNNVVEDNGCAYWNYNTWLKDGVNTAVTELQQAVLVCTTDHLTQFSSLVGGSYRQFDFDNDVLITPVNETALDIITLIGCTLSLFGLLGIWLSAALLKKWRGMASTKILLNMCVALTLQMVLILFVNTNDITEELMRDGDTVLCVLMGALLQYATLVLFVWMLIVAFLQFQRYVTVIGIQRPEHYIFKAALLAWLLPLLPTLLLVVIDASSYLPSELALQTNTGVCYPSGLGLIMGVLAPVVVVVTANSVIFVYVLYSITHTLQQTLQRVERQMIIKQLRLSVLLFFLLGLSWIFGIFSFMNISVVFSYLFCLTATLQGFVLFIYFVILDEVSRTGWLELLCAEKQKKRMQKRAPELMSMATTSTSVPVSGAGNDHHYR